MRKDQKRNNMKIAKKHKNNLIYLYEDKNRSIIESYTLIRLTDYQYETMLRLSTNDYFKLSNGVIKTTYRNNDEMDTYFKQIAEEHSNDPTCLFNPLISKTVYFNKLNPNYYGYVLVRDTSNYDIKLAVREPSNKTSYLNVCIIDNATAELFRQEAKPAYDVNGKQYYHIDINYDPNVYYKWCDFMNIRHSDLVDRFYRKDK